jgi:hypothetical protein
MFPGGQDGGGGGGSVSFRRHGPLGGLSDRTVTATSTTGSTPVTVPDSISLVQSARCSSATTSRSETIGAP